MFYIIQVVKSYVLNLINIFCRTNFDVAALALHQSQQTLNSEVAMLPTHPHEPAGIRFNKICLDK